MLQESRGTRGFCKYGNTYIVAARIVKGKEKGKAKRNKEKRRVRANNERVGYRKEYIVVCSALHTSYRYHNSRNLDTCCLVLYSLGGATRRVLQIVVVAVPSSLALSSAPLGYIMLESEQLFYLSASSENVSLPFPLLHPRRSPCTSALPEPRFLFPRNPPLSSLAFFQAKRYNPCLCSPPVLPFFLFFFSFPRSVFIASCIFRYPYPRFCSASRICSVFFLAPSSAGFSVSFFRVILRARLIRTRRSVSYGFWRCLVSREG